METNSHNLDSGKIQGKDTQNIDVNKCIDATMQENPTEENKLFVRETNEDVIQDNNKLEVDKEKVVYTLIELLDEGASKFEYLVAPIFPRCGTAVIAGKPGIGKSQLARQLSLEIALDSKSFLNYEINSVHKRAIYVSTEDDKESISSSVEKQIEGLNEKPTDKLRFILADAMDQDEILLKINDELSLSPADLVVVDSFGDIFKGSDSNNNMAMRNTVKAFDKIAKKHNCLILFVHHVNKASYKQAPGQEQIQGGSGLVQKVRLAIIIKEGEGDIRYFNVVKANNSPKELRENAIELSFSEETLLFTNTGKQVRSEMLNVGLKNVMNDTKIEVKSIEIENLANQIFGNKILSYTDSCDQYMVLTGKSLATAKRAHLDLVKREIIEQVEGGYKIKDKNFEEEIEDENLIEEESIENLENDSTIFDIIDL
ncbi:AAA family ATPase [Flavobacterium sp. M31R6]|uniref:AAA family ATPase n=1 Tax=Flavobacterium sp. M31R6 TaxID=2739062 RepID=UPI0015690F7F|nr:AAA family ATPase [Flavobacterium sp. M31R6]QKJ63351.1 AAA family ATPase [Flavobacterium sp. M31R6]